MDHHQREQRRAAAEAFNESLEQLAACFQEDLSATDWLFPAAPEPGGESQEGGNQSRPEPQTIHQATNQTAPAAHPAPVSPENLPDSSKSLEGQPKGKTKQS